MKLRFAAVVAASIIVLAFVSSLAAQNSNAESGTAKRAITEKDLFNFVWIADPQVSPDGSRALFTRVAADEKRTGYETSIWVVATSGKEVPVRLTDGKHDAHPRWSPDGKLIAFVRGGEKDDSGKPRPAQIAILSLAGGEARIITDLPKGAAGPVWSSDSKRIAFSSSTTPEDIEKAQRKKNDGKAGVRAMPRTPKGPQPYAVRRRRANTNPTSISLPAPSTGAMTRAISISSGTSTSG